VIRAAGTARLMRVCYVPDGGIPGGSGSRYTIRQQLQIPSPASGYLSATSAAAPKRHRVVIVDTKVAHFPALQDLFKQTPERKKQAAEHAPNNVVSLIDALKRSIAG